MGRNLTLSYMNAKQRKEMIENWVKKESSDIMKINKKVTKGGGFTL